MQNGLELYVPEQHRAYMKRCLKEEWGHECAYCGYREKRKELTLDHITPIAKNGTDEYSNLLPCCRKCNIDKGQKSIRQWYFDQDCFTTERWLKIKQHMSKEQPEVYAA